MSTPEYQPCTPELFAKTVAVHVNTQALAHAIVQRLQVLGFRDASLENTDPVLAIMIGCRGQVFYSFTGFDTLDEITHPLVDGLEFLSAMNEPESAVNAALKRNVQRDRNERLADGALRHLSKLEVRTLSDESLLLLQQVAAQMGFVSPT